MYKEISCYLFDSSMMVGVKLCAFKLYILAAMYSIGHTLFANNINIQKLNSSYNSLK